MSKQRIVIDTTVIISAFLRSDSPPRWILDATLRDHTLLLSDDTFEELASRLLRRKFDRYIDLATRIAFLDSLPGFAESVTVEVRIDACRDQRDNKFLELAVDGQADVLVTGDADLLILNPFRGIRIVSPREALDLI